MRLRLHPAAKTELRDAVHWYNEEYPGRGGRFYDSVHRELGRIREAPRAFPFWRRTAARVCVVPRFPYAIIFVAESGSVAVYAFAHDKRRPGYWQRRIPRE